MTLGLALGPLASFADEAKEGSYEYTQQVSGTSVALAAGEERYFVTYDGTGVTHAVSGKGVTDVPGAIWCVGSYMLVKGRYDGHRGMCRTTYADGQTFAEYAIEGAFGEPTEVEWSFVGGTGEYEGLTGGGEYSGIPLPAPVEGRWSTTGEGSGSWKLP